MRKYYDAKREAVFAEDGTVSHWNYSLCLAPYFEKYQGGGEAFNEIAEPHALVTEVGSKDEQVPGRHRVLDDHPHVKGFDRCHIKRWPLDGGATWYVSREEG